MECINPTVGTDPGRVTECPHGWNILCDICGSINPPKAEKWQDELDTLAEMIDESPAIEIKAWFKARLSGAYALGLAEGQKYKGDAKRRAYMSGHEDGRQSVLDEWEHEKRKLLDGFGHPKNCTMCSKVAQ